MTYDPLKLYYFQEPNAPRGKGNFGDELSPLLVEHFSGRRVQWAPTSECEILALGSNLDLYAYNHHIKHLGRVWRSRRPVHVWGSGFMHSTARIYFPGLRIHAVRGKLSAMRLPSYCRPDVLGDPGILADRLLGSAPEKKFHVGFVPHRNDLNHPIWEELVRLNQDATLISPVGKDPVDILKAIASCECIISTGLHPLIAADSLGVPNRWAVISDRVEGKGFKFRDYYSIFGMQDLEPLNLLEQKTPGTSAIIGDWYRPTLERKKETLMEVFPYPIQDSARTDKQVFAEAEAQR